MWGYFYSAKEVDVVPAHKVGDDNFVNEPHTFGAECICQPQLVRTAKGMLMWVHNDEPEATH